MSWNNEDGRILGYISIFWSVSSIGKHLPPMQRVERQRDREGGAILCRPPPSFLFYCKYSVNCCCKDNHTGIVLDLSMERRTQTLRNLITRRISSRLSLLMNSFNHFEERIASVQSFRIILERQYWNVSLTWEPLHFVSVCSATSLHVKNY